MNTPSYYISELAVEGRAEVREAINQLRSAFEDFKAVNAFARAKDVLYLMVMLFILNL